MVEPRPDENLSLFARSYYLVSRRGKRKASGQFRQQQPERDLSYKDGDAY